MTLDNRLYVQNNLSLEPLEYRLYLATYAELRIYAGLSPTSLVHDQLFQKLLEVLFFVKSILIDLYFVIIAVVVWTTACRLIVETIFHPSLDAPPKINII